MDNRVGGGGQAHHTHHHHHHHHHDAVQAPPLPPAGGARPMSGDGSMVAQAGWEQAIGAPAVPMPPGPMGAMVQQIQELKQMLVQLHQRVAELEEQKAAGAVAALHQQVSAVANPEGAQPYKVFAPGPVPLEGYDSAKLANPDHRTVKYVFGRVASNYPLDSVKDKPAAEALLNKMKPDLIAAGLDVKDVKGDKILVNTPVGDEWVDVVRGAGSGSPGWWWGSEGKAVPGSTPGPAQLPKGPAGAAAFPAATADGAAAAEPGAPLSTVKLTPAMKKAADEILAAHPGLKNDPGELSKEVAAYVKRTMPDLLPKGDNRQAAYDTMTQVIGIVRSMGIDAFRVVNHPTIDGPVRVGSDALVINGQIFDVFRAFGEASEPVNQNVGPWDKDRAKGLRE
ncbi:MAG: hypothetical protein JWM80_4167 [Cyanobacteria bacterium RYN_339]|nr:hypothetical protein [Cyanobacteria bacterium RYN_339]